MTKIGQRDQKTKRQREKKIQRQKDKKIKKTEICPMMR